MSVRIFGSGGGVITDATATPEDVVSGQIFYNNNGRQTGTSTNRRVNEQIYVCEKGEHSPYTYGTVTVISDVNSAYRSNPTRFYIASYRSSTGSTSIKPPSSGNTNSINMFYKIESLNIPLTSIDYISVGNIKLIFGSDQIYGVILPRFRLGYVQWMRNNKPDSSKEEPMYPVLYSSLKNDAYYLTAFGLANTAYNWVASCSTSVYTDNIPIKIATYAD